MKNNISSEQKKKIKEYQINYREKKKFQLSDSLSDLLKSTLSLSDEVISMPSLI